MTCNTLPQSLSGVWVENVIEILVEVSPINIGYGVVIDTLSGGYVGAIIDVSTDTNVNVVVAATRALWFAMPALRETSMPL